MKEDEISLVMSATADLVQSCDDLIQRIASFEQAHPEVEGVDKLARAATRERNFATKLLKSQLDDPTRIQGCQNNIRGLALELACAEWAPDVTAVRQRFANRPPSNNAKFKNEEVVEVDVVAQGGLLWIECKAERGTLSSHVVTQVTSMKEVASVSCNHRCFGRAPNVLVYTTGTVKDVDAELLRNAGVSVVNVEGPDGSASRHPREVLPEVPPPPVVANLDVTALFALVSELTNGAAASPVPESVRQWAEMQPQHAACLKTELAEPLNLANELENYDTLIAHPSVVERFNNIVNVVGGPNERRRWEEVWRPRVRVTSIAELLVVRGEGEDAQAAKKRRLCGTTQDRQRQIRALKKISSSQLDPFELGEVQMARTFTANSRATSKAAEQGVFLETRVHQTIWLVGL